MRRWLWILGACNGDDSKVDSADTAAEVEPCEVISVYVDADFDGFGDPEKENQSCLAPGLSESATYDPAGTFSNCILPIPSA